jgi:hypothetical protein
MQRTIRFTSLFLVLGVSLALLLLSVALPSAVYGQDPVIYVDKDAKGATHDGSSWMTAYTTVQDALDWINNPERSSYEIWVAEGVYYPDEGGIHITDAVTESFRINYNNDYRYVRLYGGFAATETLRTQRDWAANLTILSGDIDGNDVNIGGNFIAETPSSIVGNNAYHVLWLDGRTNGRITSATVLDGFTITAANATGFGGSLYCDGQGRYHACQR